MIKDPEKDESTLDYPSTQENLEMSGFSVIDPNDGDLLNSDDSNYDSSEDFIYVSSSYSEKILKRASLILSDSSDPGKNVFNEDIRYSSKICLSKNIIVNRTYNSPYDYKILIDNFKNNGAPGASLFLKKSSSSSLIRKFASELDMEFSSSNNFDMISRDSDYSKVEFSSGLSVLCRVVTSVKDQEKGLQGYKSLQDNEGMMFKYSEPKSLFFHMGTVSFPIDIIFCKNGEVVRIFENIQPGDVGFYGAESDCVIEVSGGTAGRSGVSVGDSIFEKDSEGSEMLKREEEGSRDIYFMDDLIDTTTLGMKVAGYSNSFDHKSIRMGTPNHLSGHKIYFSSKKSYFEPIRENFILVHDTNLNDIEVKRIFSSAYGNMKFDVMASRSRNPVSLSKYAMEKFACSECRVFDMSIEKDASFSVPDGVKNVALKVDEHIVKAIKDIKSLEEDLKTNVSVYEKYKDKPDAIKKSKGVFVQSLKRLRKKFKRILMAIKLIISGMDSIKDTTTVDEINGSLLVTTQNGSKFFKQILDMQNNTEDLEFFNNLSKRSEDYFKIAEDLETVLKRFRDFISSDILGKSLLTD